MVSLAGLPLGGKTKTIFARRQLEQPQVLCELLVYWEAPEVATVAVGDSEPCSKHRHPLKVKQMRKKYKEVMSFIRSVNSVHKYNMRNNKL